VADWFWLAVVVVLTTVSFLASERLKVYLASLFLGWLRPLTETVFPAFKLEPWLFEPIAEEDLPAWQRRYFETHTPGFLARRFSPLGDFVLRRDRILWGGVEPSCSRYFLSLDGRTIGGITCYLETKNVECMSVLLDGMYLETSNAVCSDLPPKEHGLQFFIVIASDAAAVIEHHEACVEKAVAEGKTQVASLQDDDLKAVANYGRQLAMRSLQQQGVLVELPQFLRRVEK
jgi:hypothetical protein